MKGGGDTYAAEARRQCQARRDRVLKHPDIAAKLTRHPLNFTRPEVWNGYIPPAFDSDRTENASPQRKALIAICQEVMQREQQLARGEEIPVAPVLVNEKQLQVLHICLTKYGITDREEKLLYLISQIDRRIESSKELHMDEAGRVIDTLTRLVRQEERDNDAKAAADTPDRAAPANTPGGPRRRPDQAPGAVDTEVLRHSRRRGIDDAGEPPY